MGSLDALTTTAYGKLLLVKVGRGVGSGLLLAGQPMRGSRYAAGEIGHVTVGTDDIERARAFYGALFGWTFETGPAKKGFAIATPGVPGGVHPGDKGAWPYVFFRVDDMDAALARVVELGGTVSGPPNDMPWGQRVAHVKDPDGNVLILHRRCAPRDRGNER